MKRVLSLLACLLLLAASPAKLTERQRALHALNRLGFGPRPGDVDKILAVGVDKWIARQLAPERIADTAVDQRLKSYPTLQMSDRDIVDRTGATVLYATHDLNWAAAYSDRMLVLQRGALVVDDRPAEVLRADRVRELFGFDAEVIEAGGRRWLVPRP